MLRRVRDSLAARVRAHVLQIAEAALDLYFVNREVDWFPAGGRPRLQARIVNTRRVSMGVYHLLLLDGLGERRWIDVRRGKRDGKTGRWAFYQE